MGVGLADCVCIYLAPRPNSGAVPWSDPAGDDFRPQPPSPMPTLPLNPGYVIGRHAAKITSLLNCSSLKFLPIILTLAGAFLDFGAGVGQTAEQMTG